MKCAHACMYQCNGVLPSLQTGHALCRTGTLKGLGFCGQLPPQLGQGMHAPIPSNAAVTPQHSSQRRHLPPVVLKIKLQRALGLPAFLSNPQACLTPQSCVCLAFTPKSKHCKTLDRTHELHPVSLCTSVRMGRAMRMEWVGAQEVYHLQPRTQPKAC